MHRAANIPQRRAEPPTTSLSRSITPSADSYVDRRLGGILRGVVTERSWVPSASTVTCSSSSVSSVSSKGLKEGSNDAGGPAPWPELKEGPLGPSKDLSGIWSPTDCQLRTVMNIYWHTGSLTQYARRVEQAAIINTALRAIAYESLAARCSSGDNLATRVDECRILLIIFSNDYVNNLQNADLLFLKQTSSALSTCILLRSSLLRIVWKRAAEIATPPTCPTHDLPSWAILRCQASEEHTYSSE